MERILAISDIHGQADAFVRLLQFADYNPRHDRLFLLGDYIGKGANSLETLELVEQLVQNGAIAIRGNHEQRAIKQCMEGNHYYKKRYSFLNSLPYFVEEESYIFVHAGIRPGVPICKQHPDDLLTIRDGFLNTPISSPKTVVFGHTPTDRLGVEAGSLWVTKGKIGIDTGAGHGQFLSLADLTNRLQHRMKVGGKVIDTLQFS